jgi:hypothetical protein
VPIFKILFILLKIETLWSGYWKLCHPVNPAHPVILSKTAFLQAREAMRPAR